jgi:hypothetical protein
LQLQERSQLFPKLARGDGISSDNVWHTPNTPHEVLHSTRRRVLSPRGGKIEHISTALLHPIQCPNDSLSSDSPSHRP